MGCCMVCKEVELTGENALQRLPEAFYVAFAGELVSVFGVDIFQADPDVEGARAIDYLTGTCGWHLTLMAACKRLGCEWFYN